MVGITGDTTLYRDYHNTRFVVTGNGTELNLNGHTLSTDADAQLVVLASGYTGHSVVNGKLEGAPYGIGVHIASCVAESDVPLLQAGGVAYEPTLYARCSHNPSVSGLEISGFNDGIYVSPYVSGAVIMGNTLTDVDNVPVYLDTGSTGAVVSNNTFANNGWRGADSSFARKRGHIAVDASYGNTISGNTFTDSTYKWALFGGSANPSNYPAPMIELYRNCGEGNSDWATYPVLPRVHGADTNTISGNTFNGTGLAMWFEYREHNNICTPVIYPDKSEGNSAYGNNFAPGVEHARDDGANNAHD